MKKLDIDLELLVQSFGFENDGLCKEYLDTETGNIINISDEIHKVVQGKLDENTLEDWQKEFLEEAYAIEADKENRYILIPQVDFSCLDDTAKNFVVEKIFDDKLKEELIKALNGENPMRTFKNILTAHGDELDQWYDYEEEKAKEYAVEWLKKQGVEVYC